MEPQDPKFSRISDASNPAAPTVDGDGTIVTAPPGAKNLGRMSKRQDTIMATALGNTGREDDKELASRIYNVCGNTPDLTFFQQNVTRRQLAIAVAVAGAVVVNEAYGRSRHHKGKNWPTLLSGYRGAIVIRIDPALFANAMSAVSEPQEPLAPVLPFQPTAASGS